MQLYVGSGLQKVLYACHFMYVGCQIQSEVAQAQQFFLQNLQAYIQRKTHHSQLLEELQSRLDTARAGGG